MADEGIITIEEQGIDLKKWLTLFLRNWGLFFICVIIALCGAAVLLMFTPSQYELSTSILVNKENNPLDKAQIFSSAFYSDPYQLENEKGVLNSKSVTRKAIRSLDFDVKYFVKHRFYKAELYKNTPFTVEIESSNLQPLGVYFTLRFINDTLLYVQGEGEEVILHDFATSEDQGVIPEFHFEDTVKFGEIIGNSYCRFSILPGFNYLSDYNLDRNFYFKFCSEQELIKAFRNFKIENDRGSSILNVSFRYSNPAKAKDFLNKLISEYLRRGVERDNKIASATIEFIDKQLIEIVDSLTLSGEKLQDFRSSQKVMDIGFQAEKVYSKLEGLEAQKAKLLVKKRYFNYLMEELQSKSDVHDLVAPTTLDINDPVLNSLIIELAELYAERSEVSFNSIKDNPYLRSLEARIDDTRRKLLDAADNVLEATDITLEDAEAQIAVAERTMNRLPRNQQQLLNIERKFKLNDELYTYLLTRRSEMEIFKASNLPENEILDLAEVSDARMVSPNIRLNLAIALMLGLFLPGAFLYFRETMNNKIRTREDIQRYTNHPLIGHVLDTKNTEFPAALREPNSVLTESYRTLRANLQFVIDESVPNVILVTSAIQGEGKSFTALNLASVYAFYGKKSILLDFDLRKSKIMQNLDIDMSAGLSNYLSRNASLDEVIYSNDELNFDLIHSGPVPPNPSELVASEMASEIIAELRKKYDIILIDSPPLGIVSDALMLYPYCDISLMVVRYNYTSADVFENLMLDLKTRDIDRINIVMNDVVIPRSRYGYSYGYGYGYGYGATEKKKRWFRS